MTTEVSGKRLLWQRQLQEGPLDNSLEKVRQHVGVDASDLWTPQTALSPRHRPIQNVLVPKLPQSR